jgi:hypothetical protein
MKRSWLERNFGWVRDDFLRMVAQLKKGETWVVIGMMAVFFVIAYLVVRLALRSDTMLRALHPTMSLCRELTENSVAFLFVGALFFVITAVAALGELLTYLDYKRMRTRYGPKEALRGILKWGGIALLLGLGVLIYLDSRCP